MQPSSETSPGAIPTFSDLTKPDRFLALRERKSQNPLTQQFFGLSQGKIRSLLSTLEVTTEGFDTSPGFQSPFYGDATDHPLVKLPDLIPAGVDQIDHEFNHGLHYGVCKLLFENKETWEQAVQLVRDEILSDTQFIDHTFKNGSQGQKLLIDSVKTLLGADTLSPELVKAFSWQLGALAYQHAWFVDPGMIEAVGSYNNHGIFLKATMQLNHWFGKLFLPEQNVMEGYGDIHCQNLFKEADMFQKALLIRKDTYNRESYFRPHHT